MTTLEEAEATREELYRRLSELNKHIKELDAERLTVRRTIKTLEQKIARGNQQ